MKIVAFNSSPRDNQTSKTELILQTFLTGARQAGAVTDTLYLRDYDLKHCLGCFGCWLKTQGRCVQQDDMALLLARLVTADLAVLATPLYHYNMNARLKMFVERTLPLLDPTFIDDGSRSGHAWRVPTFPRIVALSVCAFPEQDNFQALSLNMRMIFGPLLSAEIYRHSSEFFDTPLLRPAVDRVLAAVSQAGEEVVRQGQIASATMTALTADLAPRQLMIDGANQYWREQLAQAEAGPDAPRRDTSSTWV